LDFHLDVVESDEDGPDQKLKDALDDLKFLASPLPVLESLSFRMNL